MSDGPLWQIGWLALLLICTLIGGVVQAAALGLWGAGALLGWWAETPSGPPSWRTVALSLAAYAALAGLALAGQPALAAVAVAPVGVLLLAALLPRAGTGPAAGDWARLVVAAGWAALGVLALAGLAGLAAPLGSAATLVLAALLAYTAGRRAALVQGLSPRVATGVGMTLVVAGMIALAPGSASLIPVAGVALGLFASAVAPAPGGQYDSGGPLGPPLQPAGAERPDGQYDPGGPLGSPLQPAGAERPGGQVGPPRADETAGPPRPWVPVPLAALTAAHHTMAFIAPLTLAIFWTVRTFFP